MNVGLIAAAPLHTSNLMCLAKRRICNLRYSDLSGMRLLLIPLGVNPTDRE